MERSIMLRPCALAEIGALIEDPGRACMLDALMDGRSLTARELAGHAGIAPRTASGHLARLLEAGILLVQERGRHRYHRLASAEVARLLETVGQFAVRTDNGPGHGPGRVTVRTGPRDAALRRARTCYNHLAGRLGVSIADALVRKAHIELDQDGSAVTDSGRIFLQAFAVAPDPGMPAKWLFCRPCLDWSERRPHLAGTLGIAIACRCFDLGWVKRVDGSRAVAITSAGYHGFQRVFEIDLT